MYHIILCIFGSPHVLLIRLWSRSTNSIRPRNIRIMMSQQRPAGESSVPCLRSTRACDVFFFFCCCALVGMCSVVCIVRVRVFVLRHTLLSKLYKRNVMNTAKASPGIDFTRVGHSKHPQAQHSRIVICSAPALRLPMIMIAPVCIDTQRHAVCTGARLA